MLRPSLGGATCEAGSGSCSLWWHLLPPLPKIAGETPDAWVGGVGNPSHPSSLYPSPSFHGSENLFILFLLPLRGPEAQSPGRGWPTLP